MAARGQCGLNSGRKYSSVKNCDFKTLRFCLLRLCKAGLEGINRDGLSSGKTWTYDGVRSRARQQLRLVAPEAADLFVFVLFVCFCAVLSCWKFTLALFMPAAACAIVV